jgi:hypothetical protein
MCYLAQQHHPVLLFLALREFPKQALHRLQLARNQTHSQKKKTS